MTAGLFDHVRIDFGVWTCVALCRNNRKSRNLVGLKWKKLLAFVDYVNYI